MTSTAELKSVKPQTINEVLTSTLQVSRLVYQYVSLRQVVFNHDVRYADVKSKKTKIELNKPELIVTTQAEKDSGTHGFKSTYVNHEITAAAVKQFIDENTDHLTMSSSGYITFREPSDDERDAEALKKIEGIEEIIAELNSNFDADIVEFDDEYAHESLRSELVFSVIVNRTEKRVTIVFRGSVSMKDWIIDGLGIIKRYEPKIVQDFTAQGVKFHGGFSKYLFGKSRIKGKDDTKFDEIIDILEEIYSYKDDNGRDYSDYELFITGHSLGGGLSQLLAFALAGLKDTKLSFLPKDKPITAITYASPEAGNKKFQQNFTELEEQGHLRHIRVSNHGDAVPIVFKHMFYKQTGLNIHVYDEEDKRHTAVGYNSVVGFWINPFKALSMHSLIVYSKRLFASENDDLLSLGVETLYKKFAGFCKID